MDGPRQVDAPNEAALRIAQVKVGELSSAFKKSENATVFVKHGEMWFPSTAKTELEAAKSKCVDA